MKLFDFMHDKALCGNAFRDPSWDTWRVIARCYDGDASLLTLKQQDLVRKLIGREQLPTDAPRELFIGAGRRSGKTRFDSLLAVHAAAQDYRPKLAAGEWATISVHAVDRQQARVAFGYCRGLIEASKVLSAEMTNATAEVLEFKHRTRIEIHTASFRSIRGYSIALALLDEAAYLRTDDSALPDVELYRALVPALMTLRGRLVVTSSLHRKTGLMYAKYRDHFGAAASSSRVLFIQADSRTLNPTLDAEQIDADYRDDPAIARAEWGGQFRDDISAYLTEALIDAALPGRFKRGTRIARSAFVDMSGGVVDASVLGIAHSEQVDDQLVMILDRLQTIDSPHEPAKAVAQFCETLKHFGITRVTGDRYSAQWVVNAFAEFGIVYEASELDKSAIFNECSALFAEQRVELVDDKRLLTELRLLERRPRPGGRPDAIDHPRGAHDDCANAACGALQLAAKESQSEVGGFLKIEYLMREVSDEIPSG